MSDEEKDEKRGAPADIPARTADELPAGAQRGAGGADERNYKRLPFVFLFLFLGGGGFYAWHTMGGAARRLVNSDSYNSLAANTAGYTGRSSVKKEDNFFASDESVPSSGKKAEKAGLDVVQAQGKVTEFAHPATERNDPDDMPNRLGNLRGMAASYRGTGGSLGARLQARESLSSMGGGQTSQTTAFTSETGGRKPSVGREAPEVAGLSQKVPGTQAMQALKSAYKSSMYGARLTSQDAASAWVAKSFTASPEAGLSLEYTERMRSKLDKFNPDAVANFQRKQSVSVDAAKAQPSPKVNKPEVDKDGTKESLKNDKDYQEKKKEQQMAQAMSGGAAGAGGTNPAGDDSGGDDAGGKLMEDPNAKTTPPLTSSVPGNYFVYCPPGEICMSADSWSYRQSNTLPAGVCGNECNSKLCWRAQTCN